MPRPTRATQGKTAAPKAPVTAQERLTKLYRTLHDQITGEFLLNALKTCDKILRLAPSDSLAGRTKVQLLIAVDRYPAALALLNDTEKSEPSLEQIYCLYKTGRVAEAAEGLGALDEDAAEDRAVRLLEAQVKYRSEDFEGSRDVYDDLLATVDPDSPEVADLQTNLAAATLSLDFLSGVPTTLASTHLPSLESLESTPVGPIIHSHPLYKSAPLVASKVASTSKAATVAVVAKGKKSKGTKPAKEIDPLRWIPKRERPGLPQAPACPTCWRRTFRTPVTLEDRHPAFKLLSSDVKTLPRFRTRGRDVRIVYEPEDFYATLLHRIANARRRIFFASLYVGKEEKELIQALHDALEANPELRVTMVLDYLRSTRETPNPSSASLVASLCAAFPGRVELRLYHTPQLTGWRKRIIPRRFDEGWGLQHIKTYGFDDDVLLSGANLSGDYFTNRQDRYIEFLSNPPLADYFSSLLSTIASFSFLVTASDTSTKHPALSITWPEANAAPSPLASSTSIEAYKETAHEAFTSLTSHWASKPPTSLQSVLPWSPHEPKVFDTLLRPVLQMGPFNIKQETDLVVPSIFRAGNSLATAPGGSRTKIDWTSGYFSVQPSYREKVLDSRAAVRIVAASPEANGFLNSRGVSKYIPPAYTHLQKEFHDEAVRQATSRKRESHIEIREWKREGWTYHAKGIWLTPSLASTTRTPHESSPFSDPNERDEEIKLNHPLAPYLTLIGSSNYGRRSAERDLEANVLLTTYSAELRADLQDEILGIRQYAVDLVDDQLFARSERRVPWGVKVAAKAIETML
ncbi:hypothetical protein RQP46_008435 [Phenoliferia psychrophenolica]